MRSSGRPEAAPAMRRLVVRPASGLRSYEENSEGYPKWSARNSYSSCPGCNRLADCPQRWSLRPAIMVLVSSNPNGHQQATVAALLEAAKRPSERVNIRRSFVQGGPQADPEPGPLARMLRAHDERALDLLLLHRALVSSEPWATRPLDARVWARALGLAHDADGGVTAVSKTWRRLDVTYKLVSRGRSGRLAVFTALREDGTGQPYTSPNGGRLAERYFTIPYDYWTAEQHWYVTLPFAAKVVLLIGSTLGPGFLLPTEKAPSWYGLSTDSAERGLRKLREANLLTRATITKPAPLSPLNFTQEHRYTLAAPFGRPQRRPKLTMITSTRNVS